MLDPRLLMAWGEVLPASPDVAATIIALSLLAAGEAAAVALIVYKGYRASGDERFLHASLAFALIAVACALDSFSWLGGAPATSWLVFAVAYLLLAPPRLCRRCSGGGYYAALYTVAGPVGAFIAACWACSQLRGPIRYDVALLAVSHVAEAAALLCNCPALILIAVIVRVAALNFLLWPLAYVVRAQARIRVRG